MLSEIIGRQQVTTSNRLMLESISQLPRIPVTASSWLALMQCEFTVPMRLTVAVGRGRMAVASPSLGGFVLEFPFVPERIGRLGQLTRRPRVE